MFFYATLMALRCRNFEVKYIFFNAVFSKFCLFLRLGSCKYEFQFFIPVLQSFLKANKQTNILTFTITPLVSFSRFLGKNPNKSCKIGTLVLAIKYRVINKMLELSELTRARVTRLNALRYVHSACDFASRHPG